MAKGWDGWQVKTRIYNFLAGPRHAQPHQSTAASLQRGKKFWRNIVWRNRQREAGQLRNIVECCRNIVGKKIEKYCLEEQRESGQALQFPGAKAFGGFTIKSFLFASFATERSYDKRGKTIKLKINSEQVSNKI